MILSSSSPIFLMLRSCSRLKTRRLAWKTKNRKMTCYGPWNHATSESSKARALLRAQPLPLQTVVTTAEGDPSLVRNSKIVLSPRRTSRNLNWACLAKSSAPWISQWGHPPLPKSKDTERASSNQFKKQSFCKIDSGKPTDRSPSWKRSSTWTQTGISTKCKNSQGA